MSQLSRLTSDYALALRDRGENVTVTHAVTQTLNTTTGDYTEVDQEQSSVSAVRFSISKRDIALNPSKYQSTDLVWSIRQEDLTVDVLDVDDKITDADGVEYKIFERKDTGGVLRFTCRKAQ